MLRILVVCSLQWRVVFHTMDTWQHIYPFAHWWAFGLFQGFHYYKGSFNEYFYTSLSKNMSFLFSWEMVNDGIPGLHVLNCIRNYQRVFQSDRSSFYFHNLKIKTWVCYILLPTFVILQLFKSLPFYRVWNGISLLTQVLGSMFLSAHWAFIYLLLD